ncbi:MAG: polyphenol oxidase family protein [Desulfobacterales bacterium]|nr:polyphenol oxidase family protein [Desulfobacterales bacterium]
MNGQEHDGDPQKQKRPGVLPVRTPGRLPRNSARHFRAGWRPQPGALPPSEREFWGRRRRPTTSGATVSRWPGAWGVRNSSSPTRSTGTRCGSSTDCPRLVPVSGAAAVPVGDAMVTDRTGTLLVVQVADCQPVLLFDPERRVVANIHSGWRGSIANVAGRTLQVMLERFGCSARDVLAGVGPSLGPCCAEFVNYRDEIPRELWGYRRDSVYFDFWAVTRDQLMAAGVPAEHIHTSGHVHEVPHRPVFSLYRGERAHRPVPGRAIPALPAK